MQINFSEVSFYTDLESFGLPFGIEVSFWPNVGVKTTIKVETTQWRSKNDPPPNNSVEMTFPGQNDSFEFTGRFDSVMFRKWIFQRS